MCRNTNLLFLWRRTLLNKIFIILISILSLNLLFTRDFIDPTPPNRDGHCDEGLFMDCNQNCYPEVFLVLLNNENSLFLEKIINTSTSKLIRHLLRAVVLETDYTGPRIKIKGYEIGGKTGTAELIDQSGRYRQDANRTTFIGVFPMSNPKYVVLAIIDDPQKIKNENYSNTAATVAAPLVKNIILNMIKILSISPNLQNDFLKASNEKFALENKNVTF